MRGGLVSIFLFLAAISRADLTVDNVIAGEEVRYPIISVRGKCGSGFVQVALEGQKFSQFRSSQGKYVGLVELLPGKNMVVVKNGRDSVRIKVSYKPPTSAYRVRAVWFESADEEPSDVKLRDAKIDLALKLIQTSTAECMAERGYAGKTISLETDESGKVKVFVIKSPKKRSELRGTESNAIWSHAYELFKKEWPEDTLRWAGLNAFSGFEPSTKKLAGHFALGGGSLALFGGSSLAFWPASLAAFDAAMADETVIDSEKTFEDSNNRKTAWANAATGYGAWWHELGHTLGLPHSPDGFSLMSRGFDYFQRRFVAAEAPTSIQAFGLPFSGSEITMIDPFFAARWNWNPFLQSDATVAVRSESGPTIEIVGDSVTVSAPAGVRVVGAELDDLVAWFREYPGDVPAKKLKFSLSDIKAQIKSEKPLRFTATDSFGREATITETSKVQRGR